MNVKQIEVKDLVTKSNLPASDFVINPYVGCPHGCKYCYASFMKRFTGHTEKWGDFIDIKVCENKINTKKLEHKSVFLSSVTDCYNKFEKDCQSTRKILEQLVDVNCELGISTKSDLILRDIDLLKKMRNLKVSMSINTLNEDFKDDMDNAASINTRLNTLKTLHEHGIKTILFMSPMFPYLTEWQEIIKISKEYIDEYWFENLNLRGSYKQEILNYIKDKYPYLQSKYEDIYLKKDLTYWEKLALEINEFCIKENVRFTNYFYHEKLVSAKKAKRT